MITRTTGKQLGYVAQLYVDPQRLEVVSMDLRPDWLTIGSGADASILLSALRQIGDVVLVHDESALEEGAAMGSTWGAVKLVGMSVETEDGQLLGKVSLLPRRTFTFAGVNAVQRCCYAVIRCVFVQFMLTLATGACRSASSHLAQTVDRLTASSLTGLACQPCQTLSSASSDYLPLML